MPSSRSLPSSMLVGLVGLAALPAVLIASQRGTAQALGLTLEQREILAHMSIVHLEDGQGGLVKTIRITGANVQIVNGLGATNGNPTAPFSVDALETATNGLGNLIIGYAEPPQGEFSRTGSHSIVMGVKSSHSSFGGIVSGSGNRLLAAHASAIGGNENRAGGDYSVLISGAVNETRAARTAMVGGDFNLASGEFATVLGGSRSLAAGRSSTATGGYKSRATGDGASVSGGSLNRAEGPFSTISGGANRVVTNQFDWAAGSLYEED